MLATPVEHLLSTIHGQTHQARNVFTTGKKRVGVIQVSSMARQRVSQLTRTIGKARRRGIEVVSTIGKARRRGIEVVSTIGKARRRVLQFTPTIGKARRRGIEVVSTYPRFIRAPSFL